MRIRVLGSGSSGNTTLVESHGTRILIDAGLGPRELAERLQSAGVDPTSVAAVFLSHEHQDHAKGAASFSRKWGVQLWGSVGTYAGGGFEDAGVSAWQRLDPGATVAVGSLRVTGVAVPHDAAGPLAFVVRANGHALGHATDFGHVARSLVDAFADCDTVLVESNYDPLMLRDGPYPWRLKERIQGPKGHLSNGDVARYLAQGLGARCRQVLLAHLSEKNNHPELALMSAERALAARPDVTVQIAGRDGTDWIDVGSGQDVPPKRRAPEQMRLF